MIKNAVIPLIIILFLTSACDKDQGKKTLAEKSPENIVSVYSPHPIDFINPIIMEFEIRTGIAVVVTADGTGPLLDKIENEQDDPKADVLWGGSTMSFGSKEYFDEYISVNEPYMLDALKNEEGKFTNFTIVPSVLMVNTNLVGATTITGYKDLLKPELKGRIAMVDPSKSSSGWEHLVNILYAMGNGNPEQGWDYVELLIDNLDHTLVSSSSAAYQGVAKGEYAVALTFEEPAAKYVAEDAPVGIIYMKEGVIFRPDSIQIIKGARHRKNAEIFVDFVTSREIQELITEQLFRRSARKDVLGVGGLRSIDEIKILRDDEELTKASKTKWINRFLELYES